MLIIILFFVIFLIKSFVLIQLIIVNIFAKVIKLKFFTLRYIKKY